MLVESKMGGINPRTRPDQDVSRDKCCESNQSGMAIKSDSQINLDSRINLPNSNQLSDSTNLRGLIETKCQPENSTPVVPFLRSVQLLRRSNPTTQRENNFAPACKIYVVYDLLQRSKLTRQQRNFYVV